MTYLDILSSMLQRSRLWASVIICFASIFTVALVLSLYFPDESGVPPLEVEKPVAPKLSVEERYPYTIGYRSTLSNELKLLNVDSQTIFQLVKAAAPYKDLGKLMPETRFRAEFSPGSSPQLNFIKFRFSPMEMLELRRTDQGWQGKEELAEVDVRLVTYYGFVTSSLWHSAQQAQMDPYLITELAEIFAWEVDFAREVRGGDRWRISVERKFVEDEPVGWGSILAAEYENAGEVHTAALFRVNGKSQGYFTPEGESLRRMFLKSPLKYGRISSRFHRRRFHPVLKVHRPHLGVDYAAPTGTPIRAVGEGTVVFAKWSGGGGNTLKVRHNSVYTTAYKHLSRFAKGVRSGTKVSQGQIIGYVGSTGLSTGPHLHFEFFRHGRYVDPMKQEFPSADPVPAEQLGVFQSQAAGLLAALPKWEDIEVALE